MSRFKKLTLLHSNDMHGDFHAETVDETLTGGVSMLSGYIKQTRAQTPHTLYCISGDMFRGSIIDSEFKGLSTIEIMNGIAPDIVTLGNHEIDYGIAHLLFLEKCAKFPIINANLYIKSNFTRLFQPCKVIEAGGMKILFIGVLTEEVISQTKKEGLIGSFIDIYDAAKEIGKICNAYRAADIDLTVLLTHIGFEEDRKLAEILNPDWGIDLIIGGHSHTFLEQPEKVNGILITQAGTGTDQIGRFDLEIDTENNCLASWQWKSIPICPEHCPRDADLEKILHPYQEETDKKYNRILTHFKRTLTHPSRIRETELGGLLSDILRESLALDVMLLGSGSVRVDAMGPIVRFRDIVECLPYDDPIHAVTVTGRQFKQMMLYMLRDEVWEGAHTEFYQLSEGVKITYDRTAHQMTEFLYRESPIPDDMLLKVGMEKYHFINFEKFFSVPIEEAAKNKKPGIASTSTRDVIEEYFLAHSQLDHPLDGRLTILP